MKPNRRLSPQGYADRNAILFKYAGIHGAVHAADKFNLSTSAVHGIIAKMKKQEPAPAPWDVPVKVNPEPLNLAGEKPKTPDYVHKVSIFEEARDLIYGEREDEYGNPRDNLKAIAYYWEGYLNSRGLLNPDTNVGGLAYFDVCRMMELLKIARLGYDPFARDSSVDVCGYEGLVDRIRNEE